VIQKTEAIVLRTTKLRETSLIVTFFSRDFGKLQAMAKGVRQPGSPWAGLYEPMNRLEIVFYEKFRSEIHLATEAVGLDLRGDLRRNFGTFATGYYLTEVLEKFSNPGEQDLNYWNLIESTYAFLPQSPRFVSLLFQLKILRFSGFLPNLDKLPPEFSSFAKRLTPALLKDLEYLLKEDWERAFRLQMPDESLKEAEELVASLIAFKLDRKLKTRDFLEQISK